MKRAIDWRAFIIYTTGVDAGAPMAPMSLRVDIFILQRCSWLIIYH